MADPILFVSGLGRCGTTMIMTMLDAGGFPVTGPRPSYEPGDRWPDGKPDVSWLAAQGGRAVKWIDPTRHLTLPARLPERPIVILLERHPREQAKSQVKLAAPSLGRRAAKAMERSIRRDAPIMRARLRATTTTYLLQFEDVLAHREMAASMLRHVINRHFNTSFDAAAAARVVINRNPSCAADLAMETMILPLLACDLEAPHG